MHTLCKDFNIKQNNASAWLKREDYYYELEPFDLESFRGSFCLGAVDLAATTDMVSAKILLGKPKDKIVMINLLELNIKNGQKKAYLLFMKEMK